MKDRKRRNLYLKAKNSPQEIVWSDFSFLTKWQKMDAADLMEEVFQMDLDEWIYDYFKPKNDKDWNLLLDYEVVNENLNLHLDMCIETWDLQTDGFTAEKVPEGFRFTPESVPLFVECIKHQIKLDAGEFTEEDKINAEKMANEEKIEWFKTIHEKTLDGIIDKMTLYVQKEMQREMLLSSYG